MTRYHHDLARQILARLRSGPASAAMESVLRDAWATLYRWHRTGEACRRIRESEAPDIHAGLDLAETPVETAAASFQLVHRLQWVAVARHGAGEVVPIRELGASFTYPEATITYATMPGCGLVAGRLNLAEMPTWGRLDCKVTQAVSPIGQRSVDERTAEQSLRFGLACFFGYAA